jgi:hypothetical protein
MSRRLATSSIMETVKEQANLDVPHNIFWNPRRSALPRDPLFTFRGWPIPSYSVLIMQRTFIAAKSHATLNSIAVTLVKNTLCHFLRHTIHTSVITICCSLRNQTQQQQTTTTEGYNRCPQVYVSLLTIICLPVLRARAHTHTHTHTYIFITIRGPGSSVGIATDYGLDGPGIESR